MAISSRIPWHRTIRTKLIAVIILTTSAVLGIAGYFSYKYIEQQEQSELSELAEVSVPLSYMEEFYNLRLHVNYVLALLQDRYHPRDESELSSLNSPRPPSA